MAFRILILLFPLYIAANTHYEEPWGKDTFLSTPPLIIEETTSTVGKKIANGIISFYQKNISTANGPKSHYRPSSSRYMQLAISRYGFFKGFIMGCDRLLRENSDPWVYRTIHIRGVDYKYDPATDIKVAPSHLSPNTF